MSEQPESLTIMIPRPTDRELTPTEREWLQPVIESALSGVRAWLDGADLVVTPVVSVDDVSPVRDKRSGEWHGAAAIRVIAHEVEPHLLALRSAVSRAEFSEDRDSLVALFDILDELGKERERP